MCSIMILDTYRLHLLHISVYYGSPKHWSENTQVGTNLKNDYTTSYFQKIHPGYSRSPLTRVLILYGPHSKVPSPHKMRGMKCSQLCSHPLASLSSICWNSTAKVSQGVFLLDRVNQKFKRENGGLKLKFE